MSSEQNSNNLCGSQMADGKTNGTETHGSHVTFQLPQTTTGAAPCVKRLAHYSLQQTEKIHDVLRVEFVPVSVQGVCGKTESHIQVDIL